MERVAVVGVGMTEFCRLAVNAPYQVTGLAAARAALTDAGLGVESIDLVVASEAYARKSGLGGIHLTGQVLRTDFASATDSDNMIELVGYDMTAGAAATLYGATGIGPEDVDVVELHDCLASNEIIPYEALGRVDTGGGGRLTLDRDNTYGGRYVVNPSGGLIDKGHPIGATGLAHCVELTQQLRGAAGPRQVEQARIALQHILGLGGACVVGLYVRD